VKMGKKQNKESEPSLKRASRGDFCAQEGTSHSPHSRRIRQTKGPSTRVGVKHADQRQKKGKKNPNTGPKGGELHRAPAGARVQNFWFGTVRWWKTIEVTMGQFARRGIPKKKVNGANDVLRRGL